MEITTTFKVKFLLVCLACLVKFSAEDILPRTSTESILEVQIPENVQDLNEAFLLAIKNLETEKACILIDEGALRGYYRGTYVGVDKGFFEGIRNKLQAVGALIKYGFVVKPSGDNIGNIEGTEPMSNITLIPGTDLVMPLKINSSWGDSRAADTYHALPLFLIFSIPGISHDMVKFIVESLKIDIDAKDKFNRTALVVAVYERNLDMVKYLVENGANIDVTVPIEMEYATHRLGLRQDILKIFSKKNITLPDFVDVPVFVYSIILDFQEIVIYLLENAKIKAKENSWMALTYPAFQGKMEMMKILLENGFDVNCRDPLGYTALHAVSGKGHIEMAKLLLKYGADPNAPDNFGWTPLHVAVLFSSESGKAMMKLLLDSESDVNALTDGKFSPLNLAEAGVEDLFFLDYLAEKFDVLTMTDGHQGLEERDFTKEHVEYINYLIGRGADVNNQDDILGWTTLHWAAASGDLKVSKLLTEDYKASTKSSRMGMTPLGTARHFGRKKVVEYFNTVRNIV